VQPQEDCEEVVINGRRLGDDSIRRLLMPGVDLSDSTDQLDQGGAHQRLKTFLRLPKSRFEIVREVGAGGFGQVQFTIARIVCVPC
jgi:hypothetical protein